MSASKFNWFWEVYRKLRHNNNPHWSQQRGALYIFSYAAP